MSPFQPLALYVLAGFCEIGGGYLLWRWLKADQPAWTGLLGALLLVAYGWVATLQTTSFGKTYAVYGGVFVVMSIGWAWYIDGFRPDRFDVIGGLICCAGIGIILFWPRP
ncbi:YnfA family protein [Hymenobacter rubidus]|uniref:YnfA family protein n=1 Tax=Hymenobacter rubidus TaxID=1441626 RepID=UPI0019200716|nr:YnfA family protein [Hymenobacter rubidus]